jgi:branched-chain amino acid transport system substrate-binding protein
MRQATRTLWRSAAVLAVGSMVLAACSSSSTKASTTNTTAASTATSGGSSGAAVNVGFFGALTGSNGQLGINIRNGEKLAIDQYNAKGSGPKVVLKEYDSQGDPAQAPQLAQKVITDKTVAIVGPAFSGESKAADPIFEQAQVVNISPSATDDALSTQGFKYFHRIIGKNAAQGAAAEKYIAKKLKAKTIAVIDDNAQYSKGIADVVRGDVKNDNITVAVSESIDPKSQDYSSTVNKVVAAKVDAIFYGGYYAEGGRLLKQLRDASVKAPFVSDDGAADQKFVDSAGATAAEGAVMTLASGDITKVAAATKFVSDYTAAFGSPPATYSAEGFDSANLILSAIAAGKTTGPDINTFVSAANYTGITKTIQFDANGDVQAGGVYLYGIQSGKLVFIGLVDDLAK